MHWLLRRPSCKPRVNFFRIPPTSTLRPYKDWYNRGIRVPLATSWLSWLKLADGYATKGMQAETAAMPYRMEAVPPHIAGTVTNAEATG